MSNPLPDSSELSGVLFAVPYQCKDSDLSRNGRESLTREERTGFERFTYRPEGYRGNSFWFMRTSGYTPSTVTYICDFGYIYNQGTQVTCDDAALLPAISVDLSRAPFTVAPPVGSNDILSIASTGH